MKNIPLAMQIERDRTLAVSSEQKANLPIAGKPASPRWVNSNTQTQFYVL
jgi:hypothetical protein